MRQVAVCHEPLSPEARASYHAKGRFLAGFLRPGMTDLEVRQVLGGRPSGWVQDGDWWTDTYGLLRLSVRYRVADVEAAGQGLPGLVLEEVVESTQP